MLRADDGRIRRLSPSDVALAAQCLDSGTCCNRGLAWRRKRSAGTIIANHVREVALPPSSNFNETDLVDEAVGGHDITAGRYVHVTHDVPTAGEWPSLETFGLRIKFHQRVRFRKRLVVPDRAFCKGDAVRLRLRTARRGPFLYLTVQEIKPA